MWKLTLIALMHPVGNTRQQWTPLTIVVLLIPMTTITVKPCHLLGFYVTERIYISLLHVTVVQSSISQRYGP